jgi:hypothetical protein
MWQSGTHDWHAVLAESYGRSGRTSRDIERNKAGRTAAYQMIGPDDGGFMWTFCILEVFTDPGLWRVITGWAAEQPEIEWYRRQR